MNLSSFKFGAIHPISKSKIQLRTLKVGSDCTDLLADVAVYVGDMQKSSVRKALYKRQKYILMV
jgi:hypothetical protein